MCSAVCVRIGCTRSVLLWQRGWKRRFFKETKEVKTSVNDYQIPNYVMFDVNVGAQGRRGVVIFVHTSLKKSVSSIEIVSEFEETLLLSLKSGDCLLFGVLYRSPSSSESNNLALNTILSTLCVQESPKYSNISVVGDFNFPGINWSAVHTCQEGSMECKFIETLENCFLHRRILSPTCTSPRPVPAMGVIHHHSTTY